jgi:hypothetical protein
MRQERVFAHVPRLRELLPNGGWPGVVYVQALVHNVAHAAARTESPAHLTTITGTSYYTVRGPKGTAQMALLGSGEPIRGASPESGERHFYTDSDVAAATGLPVQYPIALRPGAEEEEEEPDVEIHVATQEAAPQEEVARKPSTKNMKGHSHRPNFGRRVEGCSGCEALPPKKEKR